MAPYSETTAPSLIMAALFSLSGDRQVHHHNLSEGRQNLSRCWDLILYRHVILHRYVAQ